MPKPRDSTSRHKPTLFPHAEQEQEQEQDGDGAELGLSFSPTTLMTPILPSPTMKSHTHHSTKHRSSHNGLSTTARSPQAGPSSARGHTKPAARYSRYTQNLGIHADDNNSDNDEHTVEEEERMRRLPLLVRVEPRHEKLASVGNEGFTLEPEERERLEWQTMLSSVLDGDVLHAENKRIGRVLDSADSVENRGKYIWLGLRAFLRGRRDYHTESKRLQERQARVVDSVIEDIMSFRVVTKGEGVPDPPSPMEQVVALLERLEVAQSLYPTVKAMRQEKPACTTEAFLNRVDTLISWSTVVSSVRNQIIVLQKWTGSVSLDVTQPFTSAEVPIRGPRRSTGIEVGRRIDASTFVERVLKEDSLQRTFNKKAITMLYPLIQNSRELVVKHSATLEEIGLPSFESELIQLITFPTKLISASLRMQLEYARKVTDPSVMIVDQMMDDFKLSLQIACKLKREYRNFIVPDGAWNLPPCINDDYDTIILDTLGFFFKLMSWKLKSGSFKGLYAKEAEMMEAQWELLNDIGQTTVGGGLLVAEKLCQLTSQLMTRIGNHFDQQVQVPLNILERAKSPNSAKVKPSKPSENKLTEMSDEEVLEWYNKLLDGARGNRYRKLQRYGRILAQRFSNSAEYTLESVNIDAFINTLMITDHFLIYTDHYEEDGVYIIADPSLRERHGVILQMLERTFHSPKPLGAVIPEDPLAAGVTDSLDDAAEDEGFEGGSYLIVMSPSERFIWQGLVLMLQLPKIEFDIQDKHVRLVAESSGNNLVKAKQRFSEVFEVFEEEDGGECVNVVGQLECLIEQQAHFPSINRQLRGIERAATKLAETIVGSAERVRTAIHEIKGHHDLLEGWYALTSDHGSEAQRYIDRSSPSKLNRLLTQLAIAWVSFICDDCDPTDRKIFRWAVNALEFAKLQTRNGFILDLPPNEFTLLRQKVASCMTLLISHFDILGARSSIEAKKEQERLEEVRKKERASPRAPETDRPSSPDDLHFDFHQGGGHGDQSIRLHRHRYMKQLQELEAKRAELLTEQSLVGRVLNTEKPEDRSLAFLASSQSNISMRWQQGKFIGGGAFGSVYLAHNLDSGSLMAVKEIRFKDATSLSTLYKQVRDELSVMEILSHPNIVEYYGIEVHRDKVYIFEEYCQGGSLAALLEVGRIEDETVLQVYTLQMLEGLKYLHSNGVVHRDIKPDNILLDHLGVIKFVDFGAAKVLAKNRGSVQQRSRAGSSSKFPGIPGMPTNNSLAGTPMYMSPEVIRNDHRGREGAMDIWSLGCVILECATGRKPWSNLDNEWAIMFHIGVATKHPPLPEPGQLSKSGIAFIESCLIIDPIHRPNAEELLGHTWMIELHEEMAEYSDEQTPDVPITPGLTASTLPSLNASETHSLNRHLRELDYAVMNPSIPFTPGVAPASPDWSPEVQSKESDQ